jgi:ubiquitin C-terminal hydrolase
MSTQPIIYGSKDEDDETRVMIKTMLSGPQNKIDSRNPLNVMRAYYTVVLMDRYLKKLHMEPITRTYENVRHILDAVQNALNDSRSPVSTMWTDKTFDISPADKRVHLMDVACALAVLHHFCTALDHTQIRNVDLTSYQAFHECVVKVKISGYVKRNTAWLDEELVRIPATEKVKTTRPDVYYSMYIVMRDVLEAYRIMLRCDQDLQTIVLPDDRRTGEISNMSVFRTHRTNMIAMYYAANQEVLSYSRDGKKLVLKPKRTYSSLSMTGRTYFHWNKDMLIQYTLNNGSDLRLAPPGMGVAASVPVGGATPMDLFIIGSHPRATPKLFSLHTFRTSSGDDPPPICFISVVQEASAQEPVVTSASLKRVCDMKSLQTVPDNNVVIWNDVGRLCRLDAPTLRDAMGMLACVETTKKRDSVLKSFSHIRLYIMLQNMASATGIQYIKQINNTIALMMALDTSLVKSLDEWRTSYLFCVLHSLMHLKSMYVKYMKTSPERVVEDDVFCFDTMNLKMGAVMVHPLSFLLQPEDMEALAVYIHPYSKTALRSRTLDLLVLRRAVATDPRSTLSNCLKCAYFARLDGRCALFKGMLQTAHESKHTFQSHIASQQAWIVRTLQKTDTTSADDVIAEVISEADTRFVNEFIEKYRTECVEIIEDCLVTLSRYDSKCRTDVKVAVYGQKYAPSTSEQIILNTQADVVTWLENVEHVTSIEKMKNHLLCAKQFREWCNNISAQMTRIVTCSADVFDTREIANICASMAPPSTDSKCTPERLYRTITLFYVYCDGLSLAMHHGSCASNEYLRTTRDYMASRTGQMLDSMFPPTERQTAYDTRYEPGSAAAEEINRMDSLEKKLDRIRFIREKGINLFDMLLVKDMVQCIEKILNQILQPKLQYLSHIMKRSNIIQQLDGQYRYNTGYAFASGIVRLQQYCFTCLHTYCIAYQSGENDIFIDRTRTGSVLDQTYKYIAKLTGYELACHRGDELIIIQSIEQSCTGMSNKLGLDNVCGRSCVLHNMIVGPLHRRYTRSSGNPIDIGITNPPSSLHDGAHMYHQMASWLIGQYVFEMLEGIISHHSHIVTSQAGALFDTQSAEQTQRNELRKKLQSDPSAAIFDVQKALGTKIFGDFIKHVQYYVARTLHGVPMHFSMHHRSSKPSATPSTQAVYVAKNGDRYAEPSDTSETTQTGDAPSFTHLASHETVENPFSLVPGDKTTSSVDAAFYMFAHIFQDMKLEQATGIFYTAIKQYIRKYADGTSASSTSDPRASIKASIRGVFKESCLQSMHTSVILGVYMSTLDKLRETSSYCIKCTYVGYSPQPSFVQPTATSSIETDSSCILSQLPPPPPPVPSRVPQSTTQTPQDRHLQSSYPNFAFPTVPCDKGQHLNHIFTFFLQNYTMDLNPIAQLPGNRLNPFLCLNIYYPNGQTNILQMESKSELLYTDYAHDGVTFRLVHFIVFKSDTNSFMNVIQLVDGTWYKVDQSISDQKYRMVSVTHDEVYALTESETNIVVQMLFKLVNLPDSAMIAARNRKLVFADHICLPIAAKLGTSIRNDIVERYWNVTWTATRGRYSDRMLDIFTMKKKPIDIIALMRPVLNITLQMLIAMHRHVEWYSLFCTVKADIHRLNWDSIRRALETTELTLVRESIHITATTGIGTTGGTATETVQPATEAATETAQAATGAATGATSPTPSSLQRSVTKKSVLSVHPAAASASTPPQTIRSITDAAPLGIRNINNTCYMNASLQLLFAIPELRSWLTQDSSMPAAAAAAAAAATAAHGAKQLLLEMDLQNPNSFVQYIWGNIIYGFTTGTQQDAHDFLEKLIDEMSGYQQTVVHGDVVDKSAKVPLLQPPDLHPLSEMFSFVLTVVTSHHQCEYKSYQHTINNILQVDIPASIQPITLHACIDALQSEYTQDVWTCNGTRYINGVHKEISVDMIGKYIFIQLKRFIHTTGQYLKNSSIVSVDPILEAFGWRLRLKGCVIHTDRDISKGHYIAYVRYGEIWYCVDDSYVRICEWSNVRSAINSNGYIFLYEKVERAVR